MVINKGFKELLVSSGSTSGVDKILMQEQYEHAFKGDTDLDNKIVKIHWLNELAYDHLISSINTNSRVGKVAFGLARNSNTLSFGKGTEKLLGTAW